MARSMAARPSPELASRGAGDGPKRSGVRELDARAGSGDTELYLLLFVLGVAGVVPTLLRHDAWGAQPTLALLLCVLAARALLVSWFVRRRERH
jgi:hypothetical protein